MIKPTKTLIMLAATLLLAGAVLLGIVAIALPTTIADGYCGYYGTHFSNFSDGKNLTWTLNSDSILTIRGKGEMRSEYHDGPIMPWGKHRSQIKTVVIGNGVTSIGNSAFWGCYALTSVAIPNSVTDICAWAAFLECTGLTSIICLCSELPQTTDYVFEFTDKKTCTLYVPAGSVAAYRAAQGWKEFENIEPLAE